MLLLRSSPNISLNIQSSVGGKMGKVIHKIYHKWLVKTIKKAPQTEWLAEPRGVTVTIFDGYLVILKKRLPEREAPFNN